MLSLIPAVFILGAYHLTVLAMYFYPPGDNFLIPILIFGGIVINSLILAGGLYPALAKRYVAGEPAPRSKSEIDDQITSRDVFRQLLMLNALVLTPAWIVVAWVIIVILKQVFYSPF